MKKCKSLYGFGGRCLDIREVCMDFEPCFKVHNLVSGYPKSMKLGQMTNLNMILAFMLQCQFIDWLQFETRPSSLLNFGMAYSMTGFDYLVIRPSKNKHMFLVPARFIFQHHLSFFIIFYEQRFYEQKPSGVTFTLYLFLLCLIQRKLKVERCRLSAHCCCVHTKIIIIITLCLSKLNKLVFNQYLMFRFNNIFDLRAPTYPWGKVIMCVKKACNRK